MSAADPASARPSEPELLIDRPDDSLALPASRFASPTAMRFGEGEALDLLEPIGFRAPGSTTRPRPRTVDRERLAKGLERANSSYGHPRAAELAGRLADPETVVIVTGQQAGLFGGPLFSLTKMLGVAKWARRLEEQGVPSVGVFWVATEDHDFDEIATCSLCDGRERRDVCLGADDEDLVPVGMRTLGAGVDQALAFVRELYPSSFSEPVLEALGGFYRSDARIGEAFSKLMVWLTGEHAPLLLDSMLPELKEAEGPWMRRLVERRGEVAAAYGDAERRTRDAGLKLQVRSQPKASPLFKLHGRRRCRVIWENDDRYSLRGAEDPVHEPVERLLEAIDENPSIVSPGVLSRPFLQDAVLGSSLQLMGPGELAYLPQASALYRLFDVDAPETSLRPQILVAGSRSRSRLARSGLSLSEALAPEPELEKRLAAGAGVDFVEQGRREIEATLAGFRRAALEVDSQLERPLEKTRAHVTKALETFSTKVAHSASRQDQVTRQRVEAVRSECLPQGAPQERIRGAAHFALSYGREISDRIFDQMDVDTSWVQIIDPEGGSG